MDLKEEIFAYIKNQPGIERVSRFLLKDWIIGTLGISCTREDFEKAVREVEEELNTTFPEGSLAKSIGSISRQDMIKDLTKKNEEVDLASLPTISRLVH